MRNIDRKKVSIIVPCYNLGKYLPEALDSVLAQTYDVWECVIVNDGSSDDTEQVSLDYCRRDGRFKYIVQENKGVSAARNVGIKESTGIFILPLDSDDILNPFCLEKSVGVFDSNFGVKLVYWDGERFGEKTGLRKLSEYSYDRILWENCIDACAMYKRADFDSTKGYDTNMRLGLEDWDFWLTLLDRNSVVYKIHETLYYYRIRSDSRTTIARTNSDLLMKQIYLNHQEKYAPFVSEIVSQKNESIVWRMSYYECMEKLNQVYRSKAYRLGKILLRPISLIKSIF